MKTRIFITNLTILMGLCSCGPSYKSVDALSQSAQFINECKFLIKNNPQQRKNLSNEIETKDLPPFLKTIRPASVSVFDGCIEFKISDIYAYIICENIGGRSTWFDSTIERFGRKKGDGIWLIMYGTR